MACKTPQLPGTGPAALSPLPLFSVSDFCSYRLVATATVTVGTAVDWVVVTDNFAIVTTL